MMNRQLAAALLTCLAFTGLLHSENREQKLRKLLKNKIPVVTVTQLKSQLSAKDGKKVLLLDTRERDEYIVSHLKDSRFIGYSMFAPEFISDIPKDQPIIVYCSLGVRSEIIGEKLKKAGYSNVKNLLGGLFEWVNLGLPVVDSNGNETKNVHAYSKKWGRWLQKGNKVYNVVSDQ